VLAKDKETFLQKTRQHLKSKINKDFDDYMSWWTCFDEDTPSSFETGLSTLARRWPAPEKKKRSRRRPKKTAKPSKRNNRGR
jgi:hypothetical protein